MSDLVETVARAINAVPGYDNLEGQSKAAITATLEYQMNWPVEGAIAMKGLTDLQRRALCYLNDRDVSGSRWAPSSFDAGFYSPAHRAQINALQSLVKRGLAKQRPASGSRSVGARWSITKEGVIALALEGGEKG